jgi:membrane protein required for colicin V production
MQPYDLIFLAMLAVFGFYGFTTGALRQVVNLVSFFVGIFLAALSRNFLAHAFHLDTITAYIAAFVLFIALFVGIRYLGHALSDKLHKQKTASYVDRGLGVAVGVLWTLTIMGVFHLIFSYVTPIERQPHWFVDAKVYPLSVQCAKTIQAVLPKGTGMVDKVAPEV